MDLKEFQYELPSRLIAQHPSLERDEARLMVLDRTAGSIQHHGFRELPEILRVEDLVVLNDTRVFPARLTGRKTTGARIEVLLLRQLGSHRWEALLRPSRRCPPGTRLVFDPGRFEAVVQEARQPERRQLEFFWETGEFMEWLSRLGHVPLPPYIQRPDEPDDRVRYQTVFARETGSVAAPTAGLHFTGELLERLQHCEITLHVGYGTFHPVQVEKIEEHRMDSEQYWIGEDVAERIRRQKESGRRIVAVGTTTTRTLEHVMLEHGRIEAGGGSTELFIYPGFHFRAVDALITNFHLPGSTLLMLVAAFGGKDLVRRAYEVAVREEYRFYSYGDAMLIL
ncbi:MAG: tRNA preQ1(34) S-adenosylmethionine ribosyltransferase-isomerase QueA [Acidobacteriota bacterium]